MTVIAWDGKMLAGDKRTNFGGLHGTTTKVHRLSDGRLVGCAGNTAQIAEIVHWLESGAEPDKMPAIQRDADKCVSALVILPDGAVLQYENTPHPIRIENRQWAIGSGRDFAIAAMRLGRNATEAVALTCELDSGCGNGVDALTLRPAVEYPSLTGEQIDEILDSGVSAEEGLNLILDNKPLKEWRT